MARLRDVGPVLRKIGGITFVKRLWQQISEDEIFTWGAALAYSWLFAVFPFLVLLLSLIPLVPEHFKQTVRENLENNAKEALPPGAADMVMKPVNDLMEKRSARGFLTFGLVLTLWAASSGMNMTMSALDKAYDVEKRRPFWKQRLLSIVLTIVVATLVILVMILLPVGTGVLSWLIRKQAIFPWLYVLANVARYLIALGLLFVVLTIIYHFGPSIKQAFTSITPGAVFCVAIWLLLGFLFRLYLTKLGGSVTYNKTYGAVAGAVILLLFFYLDALVLLIGAEINSEIDFVTGAAKHRVEQTPPATPATVRGPADSVQTPRAG
ncbi:MAG TPA: YihY/virulence factor BrkB family protein [Tepidisphaeraceae bacterium]